MSAGPLAGITVVSIEQAISAPMCTRTLADLGARVIKIENPRHGDFTRAYDDVVRGMASHFVWANRGKESLTLDLKTPRGLEILHQLLADADVLVSNLGPGATKRLGVDPDTLAELYPQLVTLEITGFGTDGPLRHKRAYDLLIQAESGACSITGTPGHPAKSGPAVIDVTTGLYGVIAILASLHDRGRVGRGTSTSVAMFDAAAELMGHALTHARYAGEELQPVGMGSPTLAPYGGYPTSDAQVVMLGTTNDAEWRRLATLIGRPELADDHRYRTNVSRVERRHEVDAIVASWSVQHPLDDIQRGADAAGIGNARYNTSSEVLNHPELADRGRWHDVESPVGLVTSLLPPAVIGGHPSLMGAIPGLGEHSTTILASLGLSADDIDDLRRAGVT